MTTSRHQGILNELKKFHTELKSYKSMLENLNKGELITSHETRELEKLREKLVNKSGGLKDTVIQLTGKQFYKQFGVTSDFWAEGLISTGYLPSTLTALIFCIDSTNEAIGKLESDIRLGIRDKQGNLIKVEKPTSSTTEPPKAFIAHGGKSEARDKLCLFLTALGVTPLIVEEQPSEGRSIGENVDYYAKQADCAIILATKGDIDGKTGKFIPRGNVLIEIGKAQELFKTRIIYLLQAGTKLPTNIDEKVRARFTSEKMDDAFIKIAKELTKFGMLRAVKP
jgi:predicted nucleotide-binding protein